MSYRPCKKEGNCPGGEISRGICPRGMSYTPVALAIDRTEDSGSDDHVCNCQPPNLFSVEAPTEGRSHRRRSSRRRPKPAKVELRPRSADYYRGVGRWVGAGRGSCGRSEVGGPRSHIGVSAIIAVRRPRRAKDGFCFPSGSRGRSTRAAG